MLGGGLLYVLAQHSHSSVIFTSFQFWFSGLEKRESENQMHLIEPLLSDLVDVSAVLAGRVDLKASQTAIFLPS